MLTILSYILSIFKPSLLPIDAELQYLQKMQDKSPTQQTETQPRAEPASTTTQQQQQAPLQAPQPSQIQPQLSLQQIQTQLRNLKKQNKVLETKNNKLELKYIQLFKQQKLIKKDWSVLTSVIKDILPDIGDRATGNYDLEELKELWRVKETKMVNRVQDLQQEMVRFKQKVEKQVNELAEEKVEKVNRECKQKVDNVNKQLDSFKKNSKNLGDQLSDYDKKLEAKNEQVSKLTKQKLKLQHMLNHLKMKSITDELSEKNSGQQNKVNSQINELLALRHQVSELMLKRDQLRAELKSYKHNNQKFKLIIEQKNKQIARLGQVRENGSSEKAGQRPQQKDLEQREPKLENKISIESSSDGNENVKNQRNIVETAHHLEGDDEFIHRQYMKNVFIRYMRSWAKGDVSQTQILLNIILTMLKFDSKEKELISEKKKNWWIY